MNAAKHKREREREREERRREHELRHRGLEDIVDSAGEDSFPASDPPCWSPIHLGPPSLALRDSDILFRDVVQRIRDDVWLFADTIGERNDRSTRALQNLERAAAAIETRFRDAGLPVRKRPVNETAANIEAVIRGNGYAEESVVVGAHYDTPVGSPGADDNASGVAILLALARALQSVHLDRTVRLVAFAAEEPPHLGSSHAGSARYLADLWREGPRVAAMVSLEALGIYVKDSHPWPFRLVRLLRAELAIVGDRRSRAVLARAKRAFDAAEEDIDVAIVTHPLMFAPVRTQSHYVFAREGIPAFMVTDTAPLRSFDYHREADTPDRLDYERLGCTSLAIANIVRDLARSERAAA